jgi:hypothetical protein
MTHGWRWPFSSKVAFSFSLFRSELNVADFDGAANFQRLAAFGPGADSGSEVRPLMT